MARPPLPLGTWGKIWRLKVDPKSWRAVTNYRDYDGRTRQVERSGESGAKAERRLLEHLKKRARVAGHGEVTSETRIKDVAAMWFAELQAQGKASSTVDAYADAMNLHVVPGIGSLLVREVTVGVVDRFLGSVRDRVGPSAAKHSKTVLSGIMRLAARHDATPINPVRDAATISMEQKPARALSLEQVRELRAGVRDDERARDRDIPALIDFMLGTGLRIGETLGVTWDAVDLEIGRVEVRATVVRKRGVGLILQQKPKSASGYRTLWLPSWLTDLLKTRERVANEWNVVFPSQRGKLRDRSNTNDDIRDALNPLGFDWITSHTFRKTAATVLKKAGMDDIDIANQLGHKRISMTQDVYFGRGQASPEAAEKLGAIHRSDEAAYDEQAS